MPIPSTPDETQAAWLEGTLRSGPVYRTARVHELSVETIGVGFGLDGTSARVTVEGSGTPDSLVLKWCRFENARQEVHFYRSVAPTARVRLASLLGWQFDEHEDRGVLALSDVAPSKQGDTVVGATPAEAARLAAAMADLHSEHWGGPGPEGLAALPRWCSDGPGQAHRLTQALPGFLEAWSSRLSPTAVRLASSLPDRVPEATEKLKRAPPTLVHADLHLDNVMFLPDGTPVLLDWPSACMGSAVLDLGRLLIEGMDTEVRRKTQDEVIATYLARLEDHGVGFGTAEIAEALSCVALLLYGAGIRWATVFEDQDAPSRARLVMESLVRRSAESAVDFS